MNDLPSVSSTAKQSASPELVADRVFQKLHTMYGRAWTDLWAGVPMDAVKSEWASSLQTFELETIRLALESLKTEGKTFPPNLAEFVHLCRQFVRRGPHRLMLTAPREYPPEHIFDKLRRELDAQSR